MKRAIIVGKGPGRGLAPREKTQGCSIWGVNDVAIDQYVDMVWDMHDLDWTEEQARENYGHLKGIIDDEKIEDRVKSRLKGFSNLKKYCTQSGKPLMSLRKYEDIPSSRSYPLSQIISRFDCDYFPSTVVYAVAYAIHIDYDSIECFGIGCTINEEWAYQRTALSHWMGIAKGMGKFIAVTGEVGRPLRLHNGRLYGYNTPQMERGVKTIDGYLDVAIKTLFQTEVWKES
jgi:hypothetical protein